MAEGNMDRDASASCCSVRRSRRPHSTPINFMHENRETSETPAVQTDSRSVGEGLGRTARMYVSEESDRSIIPMNHSNKDGVSSAESEEGRLRIKENTFHSTRTRHRAGLRVSHGWASVRKSVTLGRYSSAIRAACANERSCGSARGAISDGRPYRDLIDPGREGLMCIAKLRRSQCRIRCQPKAKIKPTRHFTQKGKAFEVELRCGINLPLA